LPPFVGETHAAATHPAGRDKRKVARLRVWLKRMTPHVTFVNGGTGYIGRPLIAHLISRGHVVRALARPGSEGRLPVAATAVIGNALDAATFEDAVAPADTFVHLVGTPHPNPSKAKEFRAVDRVSIEAALAAASRARVHHFVYVSVAHPAPVMRAYIDVRIEGEALVRASALAATIVRPWYVVGPGHRWVQLLQPFYALARWLPATRDTANRLGIVTLEQMVACLGAAVENPPSGVTVVEVPAIRNALERTDAR
jgi:uncharacterized protein YbjT (DUF2867 family)